MQADVNATIDRRPRFPSSVRGIARLVAFAWLACPGATQAASAPAEPLPIHYIERRVERPSPLNNEDPLPDDEGLKGAELGIRDSNATGRFVGLAFALRPTVVEPGADIRAAFAEIAKAGAPRFVVLNAPAEDVLALADAPEARDTVFLNIGATDVRLRDGDCRPRLLHVIPSRDMLTDALAELLMFKRWTRILLVSGPNPADLAYAEALRKSARKFGAKIVAESRFDARGADLRDAGRPMRPVDWAGWMAAHAVGEAAVQLKSGDPAAIQKRMLDPTFEVGGFKGRALSFRPWNGQLRQPLYLLWPGAVVAAAPIEGYLHKRTELDTLGLDQPESACKAVGG